MHSRRNIRILPPGAAGNAFGRWGAKIPFLTPAPSPNRIEFPSGSWEGLHHQTKTWIAVEMQFGGKLPCPLSQASAGVGKWIRYGQHTMNPPTKGIPRVPKINVKILGTLGIIGSGTVLGKAHQPRLGPNTTKGGGG